MADNFRITFQRTSVGGQASWRFASNYPEGSTAYRAALREAQREFVAAEQAARRQAVTIIDVHRETVTGQSLVDYFQFRKTKASL